MLSVVHVLTALVVELLRVAEYITRSPYQSDLMPAYCYQTSSIV